MFCLTYCVTELACQSQTKQSMVDILIQNTGLQWAQYDTTTTRRPMVSYAHNLLQSSLIENHNWHLPETLEIRNSIQFKREKDESKLDEN